MRLTWEGRRFLLAVVLIGVAALNTGNNLIYLILSLMISFLLLSFVILRLNLSDVSLAVSCSPPVYAGEPARVTVEVSNAKRLIPSFSVRIMAEGGTTAYCPRIGPRGTVTTGLTVTFERRGHAEYRAFTLQSGFPFILFQMKRQVKAGGDVLVYPAMIDVGDFVPQLEAAGESGAARRSRTGDDLFGIRPFRDGDDWRSVHWKATARTGGLLVREFAVSENDRVTVFFENLAPVESARFEKAVSLAASLVRSLSRQGFLVRFLCLTEEVEFGSGDEHLYRILDVLSVVEPADREGRLFDDLTSGYSVAVLASGEAPLTGYAQSCDMVLHADTI